MSVAVLLVLYESETRTSRWQGIIWGLLISILQNDRAFGEFGYDHRIASEKQRSLKSITQNQKTQSAPGRPNAHSKRNERQKLGGWREVI